MRKSLLTIAIFATVSGFAQEKPKCSGTTKAGNQCKIVVWKESSLCWRHNPNYVKEVITQSTTCTSKTKTGLPCKIKTRHESGICYHHRD
jgi:hypothetical protein